MLIKLGANCHEQVLAAAREIVSRKRINRFTVPEVIEEMRSAGSIYPDATIRTHVVSRCCSNAPDHHGVCYDYFERTGKGIYQIR